MVDGDDDDEDDDDSDGDGGKSEVDDDYFHNLMDCLLNKKCLSIYIYVNKPQTVIRSPQPYRYYLRGKVPHSTCASTIIYLSQCTVQPSRASFIVYLTSNIPQSTLTPIIAHIVMPQLTYPCSVSA